MADAVQPQLPKSRVLGSTFGTSISARDCFTVHPFDAQYSIGSNLNMIARGSWRQEIPKPEHVVQSQRQS
jgi:hypothetical protein